MIAEVISIGDELLAGVVPNTNAAYLGQQLLTVGVTVKWITTVGDDEDSIMQAFDLAFTRAQFIICTGGLGPTHDDVTKKAICRYFNSEMTLNPEILARIKARFDRRGIEMPEVNKVQALIPNNAVIIANKVGTAPGLMFDRNGQVLYVVPGVPFEMESITLNSIIPHIAKHYPGRRLCSRLIRTTGVAESTLFEKLGDITIIEKLARVAFLPRSSGVDIRLTAEGINETECVQQLEAAQKIFQEKYGNAIYGYDDESLELKIAQILLEQHKTIAVAESCTGGLIAHKLTNIPGSSGFFMRGLVTYSNEAKSDLLKIPDSLLQAHGAVSEPVARLMAENVRKLSGVDLGLATTGIAGPGGGTVEKPVGLIYIAYSNEHRTLVEKYIFATDRINNKERFAQAALNLIRNVLVKEM